MVLAKGSKRKATWPLANIPCIGHIWVMGPIPWPNNCLASWQGHSRFTFKCDVWQSLTLEIPSSTQSVPIAQTKSNILGILNRLSTCVTATQAKWTDCKDLCKPYSIFERLKKHSAFCETCGGILIWRVVAMSGWPTGKSQEALEIEVNFQPATIHHAKKCCCSRDNRCCNMAGREHETRRANTNKWIVWQNS